MHDFDAMSMGSMYALIAHALDVQTDEVVDALGRAPAAAALPPPPPQTPVSTPVEIHTHVHIDDDEHDVPVINALDFATADMPECWDDFIGQEDLKQELQIAMLGSQARGVRMPHTLLASTMPGVGKTALARLLAKTLDVRIIEIVPPFNGGIYTLVAAAEMLLDGDILFIDEIHKLQDKRRGAEILLTIMIDHVAHMPDGKVVKLNDITVVGATTDAGILPETIQDRFTCRPEFEPYTVPEMARITIQFAAKHDALDIVDDQLAVDIALASRATPRITEQFVTAAANLAAVFNRPPTTAELLRVQRTEPDGMTRKHVRYLTIMRRSCRRTSKQFGVEYLIGEYRMRNLLRESALGIDQIERFLIEHDLIELTGRGRKLTDRGVRRAEAFITQEEV